MQAGEDTGNQMATTKFNLQGGVLSLLTLVEPHPRILRSHFYLCHAPSDENLVFILLMKSFYFLFCVFSECFSLRAALSKREGRKFSRTSLALSISKQRQCHYFK